MESKIACNGPNQGAIPSIICVVAPAARPQLLHFYSYASFPALKEEVTNTWTKDQSNNDTCRHVLDFQGDLNGTGMFSCRNGDYFEGQFRGSLYDRTGHLTKPREAGCYTVGKV